MTDGPLYTPDSRRAWNKKKGLKMTCILFFGCISVVAKFLVCWTQWPFTGEILYQLITLFVNFKFDLIMVQFGTILFHYLFFVKMERFQFQLLIQVFIKRRKKHVGARFECEPLLMLMQGTNK